MGSAHKTTKEMIAWDNQQRHDATRKDKTIFSGGTLIKNPPANAGDAGDAGLIPGSGKYLGGRNGNPLHYSYLGNPTDRGAWQVTAHRFSKESDATEHALKV